MYISFKEELERMRRAMSITEVREQLMTFPNILQAEQSTVEVTRRGKPVLAIMPWEVYESLIETLAIMSDRELMENLRESIRDMEEGRTIPHEEIEEEYGK